MFRQIVIKLY